MSIINTEQAADLAFLVFWVRVVSVWEDDWFTDYGIFLLVTPALHLAGTPVKEFTFTF